MKKVFIPSLVIFLFLLLITSCKKDKTTPEVKPVEVTGKWVWIFSALDYPDPQTGGPVKLTPSNTGTTESLEFTSTRTWKKILNNLPYDSGTYYLEHGKYVNPSNTEYIYDRLNYNRNGSILGADWYEIHGDTLIFNPGFAGSYTSLNVPYIGGSVWFLKQ